MISLFISALGQAIDGRDPAEAVAVLQEAGWLSATALADPAAVVAALQRVDDRFPGRPAPGQEKWRSRQEMLVRSGYLSEAGSAEAGRHVPR